MASPNPGQNLQRLLNQARRTFQNQLNNGGGARAAGGGGGGRGGGSGRGLVGGSGLILLVGGGLALSQSLFNVDGGHRAVKYSRISGVLPNIYPEGTHLMVSGHVVACNLQSTCSLPLVLADSMDRNPNRLRRPS